MADVVGLLKQNKVRPEAVETFAIGDDGASITFSQEDQARLVTNLTYQGKEFRLMNFGKQIIGVKLHWLPVFVGENCIRAILAPYGKVMTVEKLKANWGEHRVNNGQWFATLEVDEVKKINIPHLLRFACGSKALLTIRGRPPLCLRCYKVGHLRNVCEGYSVAPASYNEINRSFAEVISGRRTAVNDDTPETDAELAHILEMRKKDAESRPQPAPRVQDKEAPQESPEAVGTEQMSEVETESEGEGKLVIDEDRVEEAGSRGEKRPSDESDFVPDSFDACFPPNRPVKASRKTGGSVESGGGISTSNSFDLLTGLTDSSAGDEM